MKLYETVFILIPQLSEEQAKSVAGKFRKILRDSGATIVLEENWGKRESGVQLLAEERWAALEKKESGYYYLFEFTTSNPHIAKELEIAYTRDERVLRFLTVRLDKH